MYGTYTVTGLSSEWCKIRGWRCQTLWFSEQMIINARTSACPAVCHWNLSLHSCSSTTQLSRQYFKPDHWNERFLSPTGFCFNRSVLAQNVAVGWFPAYPLETTAKCYTESCQRWDSANNCSTGFRTTANGLQLSVRLVS